MKKEIQKKCLYCDKVMRTHYLTNYCSKICRNAVMYIVNQELQIASKQLEAQHQAYEAEHLRRDIIVSIESFPNRSVFQTREGNLQDKDVRYASQEDKKPI